MKLRLKFNPEIIRQPIIAETILETGARIDIELARVDGTSGEIVISVPEESCRSIVSVLRKKKVDVTKLGEAIVKDDNQCVHCGACVSVCPVDAISYEHDWQVTIDKAACVQCGTCTHACPTSAIRLTDKQ
ncbi:4Fe-4S binding protein [Methanocella arvoryzae]|uniref:2(4Fe-4S) ferredoxin-domain protein n=1 Tax=Methanocella arvoryzae (strain DSM 22066 / NBRC 105507 / MRE50) TaxID=351160 RepID=Q0W4Z9_METAR|nr:4Fe-4S binding protein [Methanocella arvoryzae]CAJ36544.1 2(4Fe-4S) ferredoxin-domain protein [Methanocella arvoryzae MRE50]